MRHCWKNLNPQIHDTEKKTMMEIPEGVDAELLAKVLSNPEMAVLLTSLAKSMQGEHNEDKSRPVESKISAGFIYEIKSEHVRKKR